MSTPAVWRSLGAVDARNVSRDPMLWWILVLTPASGLLFRFAVPAVAAALRDRFGFDLEPYYPLIVSVLPLAVAGMVGAVVGFLLLDQRDDQTLTALLVTPLTLTDYLRYRLTALLLASIALTSVTVPLAGLRETTMLQLAVTSVVAAPLAPIYALLLGSFAANKVQGFALSKAVGVVLVPALVSWFVAAPSQYAFGVIPHYWPLKVFWLFDEGRTGAALAHALIGLAWQGLLVAWLGLRFARVVRQ